MLKSESHEFIFLKITGAAYSDHFFNYIWLSTRLRNSPARFLPPPTLSLVLILQGKIIALTFKLTIGGNIKGITDVSFLWLCIQSIAF